MNMDWPQDLLEIFDDPMFYDVHPKAAKPTIDERFLHTLNEVEDWVKVHGRRPERAGDLEEKIMYSKLVGLQRHSETQRLREYDRWNLLEEKNE